MKHHRTVTNGMPVLIVLLMAILIGLSNSFSLSAAVIGHWKFDSLPQTNQTGEHLFPDSSGNQRPARVAQIGSGGSISLTMEIPNTPEISNRSAAAFNPVD